ncbi:MAG: hypothetical protein ACLFPA_13205 [Dichotomicrobium sp.]
MKPLILFGDTHRFPKSSLYKGLRAAGLRWIDGNRLRAPREGVLMAWEKYPECDIRARFKRVIGDRWLMNEHMNTDKDVIDRAHEKAFGYGLAVDPRTYEGEAVQKSKKNARHDGRIVRLPIDDPRPSKVYQLVIDNTDGAEVEDIRLEVLRGKPVICYAKRRLIAERFLNTLTSAAIVPVGDMLSADELAQIEAYCAGCHLDYGALDILRDRKSEKIHVCDANSTPRGPPKALSDMESARAAGLIGEAFAAFLGG